VSLVDGINAAFDGMGRLVPETTISCVLTAALNSADFLIGELLAQDFSQMKSPCCCSTNSGQRTEG